MLLKSFLDRVDLEKITAKNTTSRPSNLIFLCGGSQEKLSLRSELMKYLRARNKEVFKAEDIINWSNSQIFAGDLLELEKYIAALSGIIVLICESAGSIAELGSFVNDKQIRDKLLVVIERKYKNSPSFIVDGLLANLERTNSVEEREDDYQSQHICVIDDIPFCCENEEKKIDISSFDELNFDIICQSIDNFKVAGGKIDLQNSYYQALFILDIIMLSCVISFQELHGLVKNLKLGISKKSLQKVLLILEKLRLVYKEEIGNKIFYISKTNSTFLSYKYKEAEEQINTNTIKEQSRDLLFQPGNKIKQKLWNKYISKDTFQKASQKEISEEKVLQMAPLLYKVFEIPKKKGGMREIAQPVSLLKEKQREYLNKFSDFPIHPAAKAYQAGVNGILANATAHIKNKYFLKLDFSDFFHSIRAKEFNIFLCSHKMTQKQRVFFLKMFFMFNKRVNRSYTKEVYRILKNPQSSLKNIEILMTDTYTDCFRLSIGAPSSPMLSNFFMYSFDSKISQWATKHQIVYSRYADDLVFSSKKKENFVQQIMEKIQEILSTVDWYGNLKLNKQKTKFLSFRNKVTVTGLNITPTGSISIGREQKKKIRAMLFAIRKGAFDIQQRDYLKGWINYIHTIEPIFYKSLEDGYGEEINSLFKD